MSAQQQKRYYFMSGLPRAGSTLLSSILNQNPNVYSGPSSPVVPTMLAVENSLAQDELFLAYPKRKQAAAIISSIMPIFYSDTERPIIIDKNRSWVNRLYYIPGYFGIEPKIICPVRDIKDILSSFIAMQRRNIYNGNSTKINFIDEMLIKSNVPLTDDNRCEFLTSPMGILGQSYNGIKQAIVEGRQKCLHFVEYDELLNYPEQTMQKIYEFLGEEPFQHDFTKIENIHRENDEQVYGMADMHEVRKNLNKRGIIAEEILSKEVLKKCENTEFWRHIDEPIPEDKFATDNSYIDVDNQQSISNTIGV